MKEFNLITKEEKNQVHDSQIYNRIVRAELDRKQPGRFEISERAKQLMKFRDKINADKKELRIKLRDKINADKKELRIKLRAEALNLLEKKRREILPRFLMPEMIGTKILNMDNSLAKKYKEFFNIDSEISGEGTSNGSRFSGYVTCQYRTLYLKLDISLWQNHVTHNESGSFVIYDLEDDGMTVKNLAQFEEGEMVKLKAEKLKAKKYLEYLKKSEKKLEELRKACHPYILETIKNNQ